MTLREELAKNALPRDWVVANFVTNAAGDLERNGSSRGISNEVDRASLLAYRDRAEVILTSAKTAQAEQYLRPKNRALAIASRNSDFSGIPAVTDAEQPLFLITTRKNAKRLKGVFQFRNVYLIGLFAYTPRHIRRALKIRGYRRTVLEAGVLFTNWFADGRALNELALTIVETGDEFNANQAASFLRRFNNLTFKLTSASTQSGTTLSVWAPRLKK